MTDSDRKLERTLVARYEQLKAMGLALDLTRGKPAADQLDLANALDGILGGDYRASDGTDTRNYGGLRGIPEARALGADLLDVPADHVIAGGNSSLQLMHLVIDTAMHYGLLGEPMRGAGPVKAICPVPGYDRHFALSASFGIDMVTAPMTDDGPDPDALEALVRNDPACRFLWCVPKYANPTGCIYSPEVVERIASLPNLTDGPLFILWDNAYAAHDFEFPRAPLENVFECAGRAGTADRIIGFASTSKITFAGAGVGFIAGSGAVLDALEARMSVFTIGPDKVNQLRHARLLQGRIDEHMARHAALVRPRFEATEQCLQTSLGGTDIATWTRPRGGYFVSLDTKPGLAKTVVRLAKEAGVALTPAGATFPNGIDPEDKNIRIAPTFATVEDIEAAIEVLGLCIQLATVRQRLEQR